MNTPNLKCILENRFINFVIKGIKHNNNLVSSIFKNSCINGSGFMLRNVNSILKRHKINYRDIFEQNSIKLKENIYIENWKLSMLKELFQMRDFGNSLNFNKNEINHIIDFICLS